MTEEKIVYEYVGPGAGVTGLPHKVTETQAKTWEKEYKALKAKKAGASFLARTPWGILQGALERGTYIEKKAASGKKDSDANKKEGGK